MNMDHISGMAESRINLTLCGNMILIHCVVLSYACRQTNRGDYNTFNHPILEKFLSDAIITHFSSVSMKNITKKSTAIIVIMKYLLDIR